MSSISKITEQALSLPLIDRIQLAQELWSSVHPPSDASLEAQESAALDLAEQRDAELERDPSKCISHNDAMAKARKSL